MLPFIEQNSVFNAMNIDTAYGDLVNKEAVGRVIAGFLCPSESAASRWPTPASATSAA